jgi:type III secretory pathway component EscV
VAGELERMVVTALVLLFLGVILGLFFPVMFVAALAGVVLLVVSLFAAGRRAQREVREDPDAG